ncbi:MAG: galactokinase [Blastocatellia bacterium]|jgi:galactokinase|nr:galactokinase [Blastocatellia bacterium]
MVDILKLKIAFAELSADEPRLFSAPGRVNLIGEHTDYNEGFVLPLAADLRTYVAVGLRSDGQFRVYSVDLDERASFSLNKPQSSSGPQPKSWLSYIQGITHTLSTAGLTFGGANLVIASDVPIGAGLSSSAALEISVGFALCELAGLEISRLRLAQAAQEAEHVFVGTNSGLMDQMTAALAQAGHAMLIDCRLLQVTHLPMRLPTTAIVVCDTRVKHALVSSAYNDRRRQCERAVKLLRAKKPAIRALRDLGVDDLHLLADLPEPERRRARHVVTENERTLTAAQALKAGDVRKLGTLMVGSHQSLRDDFDVSCRELDIMFELALKQDGVSGARMMGGGFGGCTINLVDHESLGRFTERMSIGYEQATGLVPTIKVVQADGGVSELLL